VSEQTQTAAPVAAQEPAPALAVAPEPTETWGERLSERLNPIIVKEVRQGLRTRVFWICFSLMLFACLIISLIAFASTRQDEMAVDGDKFFFAFFFCVAVVQFFIIPYSAYRSLAREREDETWVLLTLTGLGPRKILRGKLGSFLIQAALYASAATPFMLFSYYLNGIDMPTILTCVALGGAYSIFLTSLAVSAATLAQNRFLRALGHFLVLGLLLGATAAGLGVIGVISNEGQQIMREKAFIPGVLAGLWLTISFGMLLFEGAASRLTLATENYVIGPRLVFVGMIAVSAGIAGYVWWDNGEKGIIPIIFEVVFAVAIVLIGFFVAADLDGQTRAQRETTRWYSLWKPGALRGFRLTMLLLAGTFAFFTLLVSASDVTTEVNEETLSVMVAAPAYVALYLSLSTIIARARAFDPIGPIAASRLIFIALVFLGATMPPLIAAMGSADPRDSTINVFNPVLGLINFGDKHHYFDGHDVGPAGAGSLVVLCFFAVVSVVIADRVLAAKDKLL
jgi:hypothetical protein